MFTLAFILGIASYAILALGLASLFNNNILRYFVLGFLLVIIFWLAKKLAQLKRIKVGRLEILILIFLGLQILVNLPAVFGPELAFDALWYHLTLPKIYLQRETLVFIPGGLLYYSGSPQFMEMLYVLALSVGGLTLAKWLHFLFGLLSVWAIYSLARKFLPRFYCWLICLIFYTQLAVSWVTASAYTDMALVFFQTLGLLAVINWLENPKKKSWLIEAGFLFGLGMAVKLTAGWAALALLIIFIYKKVKKTDILMFLTGCLVPLLPWFVYAYKNTGNFLYPYFTDWFFHSQSAGASLSGWFLSRHPLALIQAIIAFSFTKSDILSPLILICLPLFVLAIFKRQKNILLFFLGLNFLFWFLTPLNYNRFALFLVPIYFIVVFRFLIREKKLSQILSLIILLSFLSAGINTGARFWTNKKFLPLLLKEQTQDEFMKKNLNLNAGNFYDFNGHLAKIVQDKQVLVKDIHNLYYLDFPFIHVSYLQSGETYDYILQSSFQKTNQVPVFTDRLNNQKLYKVKIKTN